jgi:hypothetical protein
MTEQKKPHALDDSASVDEAPSRGSRQWPLGSLGDWGSPGMRVGRPLLARRRVWLLCRSTNTCQHLKMKGEGHFMYVMLGDYVLLRGECPCRSCGVQLLRPVD